MTTKTLALTDFLLARIAEDEASAKAAEDDRMSGPEWYLEDGLLVCVPGERNYYKARVLTHGDNAWVEPDVGRHIARHDPARVLAECAAKRRIVELVGGGDIDPMLSEDYDGGYASCWEDVLRLLAAPYAEHPDWREDWKL